MKMDGVRFHKIRSH